MLNLGIAGWFIASFISLIFALIDLRRDKSPVVNIIIFHVFAFVGIYKCFKL